LIDAPPALSVLVATIRGWPEAHLPVDALCDQVERLGAEMIVMDGSGRPPPNPDELGAAIRWISRPGQSVFQLRQAGYAMCRGELVALTEDHVEPAPDWCERILAAHAANPEAIAIGGAIENGTTDHLVDWATFIVTQSPFVPPLENGPADKVAGAASISYRRDVLDRRPDHGSFGAIELFDTEAMRRPGEVLLNDDSIRVKHHQSMGIGGTAAAQFHNGRTIAGLRRAVMSRGDWLRVVGFPALPLYRTARSVGTAWRRAIPRTKTVTALPLIALLHYSQAVGELIGYLTGPGSSPKRVR
jgi:hypothetical protein